MAQSVGISWLWQLKSDATGSIPAGWVRGVTWVQIFLYSSILTSLRKENHLVDSITEIISRKFEGFVILRCSLIKVGSVIVRSYSTTALS